METISALEAKYEAQKIAFGPIVFQAVEALKKLGILELIHKSRKGISDEEISETSYNFSKEMGGISTILKLYIENYRTSKDIKSSPDAFLSDTNGFFLQLEDRIERENKILYPLFDKLH